MSVELDVRTLKEIKGWLIKTSFCGEIFISNSLLSCVES